MRKFSKLSFGNKILLINLCVTLGAIFIAGIVWLNIAINNYAHYFSNRIASQAQLIANNSTAAILFHDWDEIDVILSALKTDSAITSASIYINGVHDMHELHFKPAPMQVRYFQWMHHTLEARDGTIAVPISVNGSDIGKLSIHYHTNEVYSTFTDIMFSLMSTTIIAVLGSVLLLGKIQNIITTPIRDLSFLAREVRHTRNYALRGKVSFEDEIGQLTADFNSMLDIIESRDIDMGEKVKLRTIELARKNSELENEILERKRAEVEKREVEERFEKAFLNAPIGMALVNSDKVIFRSNQSLNSALLQHPDTELYLNDFIEQAEFNFIENEYECLVRGDKTSFEVNANCFDSNGNWMSAILSFSSIRDDKDQFRYAVLQFQNVTESKQLSKELEYQASHDVLTLLPNRRVLEDAIREVSQQAIFQPYALGILDLDQFKVVNDTCGHVAGDELLRQVSQIIRGSVGEQHLVVRLGGDEFAVLWRDCPMSSVAEISEKIRESVQQWEFNYEGTTFRVGVSIGVYIAQQNNIDSSLLMKNADVACYIAKDSGRNCAHIIDGVDTEVIARQQEMDWVQKIHRALEYDHFILFGQPIKSTLLSNDVRRMEILLRIKDEHSNKIYLPGAFIPAAERYGLMDKIDLFVIKKLVTTLKSDTSLYQGGQSYWVNLSALSLNSQNFLAELANLLKEASLPAETIGFEITETAVMSNLNNAKKLMECIQAMGCKFALDDFGSGMSSFGYLKNLPVDYIKIDGMFVKDIVEDDIDLIFVKSIIDVATVMGIETIAEFVENEGVYEKLKELGANYVQGYFIGHPFELSTLTKFN